MALPTPDTDGWACLFVKMQTVKANPGLVWTLKKSLVATGPSPIPVHMAYHTVGRVKAVLQDKPIRVSLVYRQYRRVTECAPHDRLGTEESRTHFCAYDAPPPKKIKSAA